MYDKILIPSVNRSDTISTPKLLGEDLKKKIVVIVHNDEEYKKYKENPTLKGVEIVVSNVPCGDNVAQHRWKIENIAEKGNWYICLDDNILGWTAVSQPFYDLETASCSSHYKNDITGEEFIDMMANDLSLADEIGARVYGTAVVDNWFFRKKKYKTAAFILHKCHAIKKTSFNYDENILIREEWDMTAQHLLMHGKVLRNDYLFAKRKYHMKGGCGAYDTRKHKYASDCKYLMAKYPGLFRYAQKKDKMKNSEIRMKIHTEEGINKWRHEILSKP